MENNTVSLRQQAINKVADYWNGSEVPMQSPHEDEFVMGQIHAIALIFGVGTVDSIYREVIAAQGR